MLLTKSKLKKWMQIVKQPNVGWSILGITANAVYVTILSIFITRTNGGEQAWLFAFAINIIAVFQTVGNYGGRIYQVADVKKEYQDNTYVSLKVVTAAVMIGLTLVFCFVNGYSLGRLTLMLILVSYRFFENISEACFGVLQKNNRLDIIGKSMFFKAAISSIIFLLINYLTRSLHLAGISFIIVYGGMLICYDWRNTLRYSNLKLEFDKRIVSLGKRSFQVFLYTFLNIFILNITRYFVDMKIAETLQNDFNMLVIPVALIALLAQFLIQPMVTSLVEKYETDIKSFIKTSLWTLLALVGIGLVGAVISYFVLVDMLSLVFGEALYGYRLESALLILTGICSGGTTIISMLMVIMKKLTAQSIAYIAVIIISIAVSGLMVKESVTLALYAYMIGLVVQFLIFIALFVYYLKVEKKARG